MEFIRKFGTIDLPVQIECGIEGIKNLVIAHAGHVIDNLAVMHKDVIIHRGTLKTFNQEDQRKLLLSFFEKLNSNSGVPRPAGLYGRA
jgi:hypothetical protein